MFTKFQLQLYIQKHYALDFQSNLVETFDPSAPLLHRAEIPPDHESATLKITSLNGTESKCMLIYVLPETCPLFSLDGKFFPDPDTLSLSETANSQAGFSLSRERFPNGFTILVQSLCSDEECGGPANATDDRTKTVKIDLESTLTEGELKLAISSISLLFSLICLASLGGTCCLKRQAGRSQEPCASEDLVNLDHGQGNSASDDENVISRAFGPTEEFGGARPRENIAEQRASSNGVDELLNLDSENVMGDASGLPSNLLGGNSLGASGNPGKWNAGVAQGTIGDLLGQAQSGYQAEANLLDQDRHAVVVLRNPTQVQDDSTRESLTTTEGTRTPTTTAGDDMEALVGRRRVQRDLDHPTYNDKSERGSSGWVYILTAGVFYIVPVVQLVQSKIKLSDVTGDQDVCFYNSLCTHSLLGIKDFNHVFSNIGYLSFGLMFMAITKILSPLERKSESGLHDQTDFYYALGSSLALEGVMSACYHVCPTQENLQFDILYICIFLILILMKNYSISHGLENGMKSTKTLCITLMLTLGITLAGIFDSHAWLKLVLAIILLLSTIYVSFSMYHPADGWQNVGNERYLVKVPENVRASKPALWSSASNVVLIFLGIIFIEIDLIPRFKYITLFLLILTVNVVASTAWVYFYLQRGHHSWSWGRHLLGITSSIILMLCSLAFFAIKRMDSSLSPAESRGLNAGCQLFDFYDFHDLWHIFSSLGTYVALLTIFFLDKSFDSIPRQELYSAFSARN